ncbi:Stromal processing peptidase chloroplastic [Bienertia sinuspersici]
MDAIAVKHHVWCSAVGPEEPHAVSTSLQEGTLEKSGANFLDPEVRRVEVEEFLNTELPPHPKLYRGQLKNGLRYIILPNKVPPNRFEAHMEVHVGSIDEEDDEQGIAHMIEHVAFLGSKKREKLLGTGARSNAYTDFHHTVFHIHSPTRAKVHDMLYGSDVWQTFMGVWQEKVLMYVLLGAGRASNLKGDSDGDLLSSVLDALNEIAFHPKFLASRVEKERRAILSELQMMNTIEYRVDCQLLQHLHSENKLSGRFPIGLEEQIKKWDVDKIKRFHERWYFPANATLYIVGDVDNISKTIHQIEAVFSQTGLENETEASPPPTPNAFGAMASFLVPKFPVGLGGTSQDKASNSDQSKIAKKERHAIRPPVRHNWSLPGSGCVADPPQIFQHELLQNFSFNMFCKVMIR